MEKGLQALPVAMDIGQLLAEAGLGRDPKPLFLQPVTERRHQRGRSCLPGREALTWFDAVDVSLDLVELGNTPQALGGDLGAVAVEHLLQLAAGVRPTM